MTGRHSEHRRGGLTAPEGRVGAKPSEQPETRDGNNITAGSERTITFTRRNFIIGAAGAAGLAFAAGAPSIMRALRGTHGENLPPALTTEKAKPPATPTFENDLRLRAMQMPETLNAPTYQGVVTNFSQALQYAVNHNNPDLIRRLIPGGEVGELQPDHFTMRAEYIAQFRTSNDYMPDAVHNPNDPRYFAWGFDMEFIELVDGPADPNSITTNGFTARVRVQMGELPPLLSQQPDEFTDVEASTTTETNVTFTRFADMQFGGARELTDINGGAGRGWGWANATRLYPIPTHMVPERFAGNPPPLFAHH